LRLLTWNIGNGGSQRADAIIATICQIEPEPPDVVVLIEYGPKASARIISQLAQRHWPYRLDSQPPIRNDGVSVQSRLPIRRVDDLPSVPEELRHRFLAVHIEGSEIAICGAYVAYEGDPRTSHRKCWECVALFAQQLAGRPSLIVGDLNSGVHGEDWRPIRGRRQSSFGSKYFSGLCAEGWADVWRTLNGTAEEYSYYLRKGEALDDGMRLDHVLASPALGQRLMSARYLHSARQAGYSDHSPLLVEVADN
jgi:exonuclease III